VSLAATTAVEFQAMETAGGFRSWKDLGLDIEK
jgi:hypothetical protein